MRRVSSRRKSKSPAARKRLKTKAQKPTVVALAGKRGPVPSFYVVGLGASAGGLEALRSFFAAVPARSGAAFVVIQHLAPDHRSQMVELLATHTAAPVSHIEDGMTIEPDRIYVIPPGKYVKIFRGKLLLLDPEKRALHLPIDQFFRSLAEDRGELAIGIALSGTGSDGTLGVRAIKEAGGTVMVQDEGSAKFSGMPDSAGATGLADYVLPPAEMARKLLLFIRHPLVAHVKKAALKVGETTMQQIVSLIHEQTGIDFTSYKQSTVARRIQRRIGIAQLANPEDYLEFLEQSPQEVAMLGRDLLINVTRFFRDGEVFDVLRGEILPAILKRAAARKALRIWVPGCATGEEAYSIAMLVQELVTSRGEKWDVKIFATDVDKVSIEHAGRGLYHLIDDLLDLTRITGGKLQLRREITDVHLCLRQAIGICQGEIDAKKLQLAIELDAPRHFVEGDGSRLQQVFWNLIKNAVKFTSPGGQIAIETRCDQASNLTIEVRDTGIGIESWPLRRIFDPFFQVEHSLRRRVEGLGLGLAICKAIIEGHGGTLTAASAGLGKGTTFRLELATVAEPNAKLSRPAADASASARRRNLRLLLVEDHDDTREVLARLLRRRGYKIEAARSAQEARSLSSGKTFDLLVSDIALPDATGCELLKELGSKHRLRGIAMSGFGSDADLAQSRAAGFLEHLVKPIDAKALDAAIQRLSATL